MPGWMGEDFAANEHGLRSRAKISNYQQWLLRTRREIAESNRYIRNQDRDDLRFEKALLEKVDRDDGLLNARRRIKERWKKLRDMISRLNRTRAARVKRRREMLEKDAAQYKKLLEEELKLYDDMMKNSNPKPNPENENEDTIEDDGS